MSDRHVSISEGDSLLLEPGNFGGAAVRMIVSISEGDSLLLELEWVNGNLVAVTKFQSPREIHCYQNSACKRGLCCGLQSFNLRGRFIVIRTAQTALASLRILSGFNLRGRFIVIRTYCQSQRSPVATFQSPREIHCYQNALQWQISDRYHSVSISEGDSLLLEPFVRSITREAACVSISEGDSLLLEQPARWLVIHSNSRFNLRGRFIVIRTSVHSWPWWIVLVSISEGDSLLLEHRIQRGSS